MKDTFGNRMKEYENTWKRKLMHRMPIIIRIDGKAFHSYTNSLKFKKPFDASLLISFQDTAKYLLNTIQGAELAYTQSDEISLFLNTYKKFNSEAWFDRKQQKIVSVSASMATYYFNLIIGTEKSHKPAIFDSRAFNLEKNEVYNYFLWRYKDAYRNAIQSIARHNFGHSKCKNKSTNTLLSMIENDYKKFPDAAKHGTLFIKDQETSEIQKFSTNIATLKKTINKVVEYVEKE